MMTNKMTVKGADVLDMKLLTINEAELLIEKATHMEGIAFWMQGKAWTSIKNLIDSGKTKYNSFFEYYNVLPVGKIDNGYITRLCKAFELVEEMIANGVPYDELPKSEHECRVLRLGVEDRRADKAALKVRLEMAREESLEAFSSNPELAAEIVEDQHQQQELRRKENQNEKFTKKPEFAHAVNDMNVGSQITEAGRDAERLDIKLKAIILAARGIGENGAIDYTELTMQRSLRYFAQLNQTLNKILNNK